MPLLVGQALRRPTRFDDLIISEGRANVHGRTLVGIGDEAEHRHRARGHMQDAGRLQQAVARVGMNVGNQGRTFILAVSLVS